MSDTLNSSKMGMDGSVVSGRAEWSCYWYLPLVAALGYSSASMHVYVMGPLMEPLQQAFGWTRTQTLSGSAIVSAVVAIASVPMGVLIDRLGPRRIGLIGLILIGGSVAALGTATGTMTNWLMLWALVAVCSIPVQATVWTSAVVSRYDASRGMALAVTLCGSSVSAFVFPLLSTVLAENLHWRQAFLGLGAGWVLAMLPLVYLYFRGAQDGTREALLKSQAGASIVLSGLTLKEATRTSAFYRLLVATGLFAFAIFGAIVNFVPILKASGAAPMLAASAASFIGVFSLIGRLCTGAVLDRFPAHLVGSICFLIPIPACILLLTDAGSVNYFVAAALFGLTLGAEIDIVFYLATRYFGLKNFGAIQGALLCAVSVGAAMGPLGAAATFDHFRSYANFLGVTIVMMFISALIIGTGSRGAQSIAVSTVAKVEVS